PGHHTAVVELHAVAPNLKDHAPEVPDLVVDPDVRREPLAGDVRAEFDRRRGLRTESRGVVDTIQPERMPAETRIPFDRGLLVRHVRPRLAAQRSAGNRRIDADYLEERHLMCGHDRGVVVLK